MSCSCCFVSVRSQSPLLSTFCGHPQLIAGPFWFVFCICPRFIPVLSSFVFTAGTRHRRVGPPPMNPFCTRFV